MIYSNLKKSGKIILAAMAVMITAYTPAIAHDRDGDDDNTESHRSGDHSKGSHREHHHRHLDNDGDADDDNSDTSSNTSKSPSSLIISPPPSTSLTATNQPPAGAGTAIWLEQFGANTFFNGVIQIARGITQLSNAGQVAATNGQTPATQQATNQAVAMIYEGNQNLAIGRGEVAQANAIRAQQANMASVGVATAFPVHELRFDQNKIDPASRKIIKQMEDIAGIPGASLATAVNRGGKDSIAVLAASAKGVKISAAAISTPPAPSSNGPKPLSIAAGPRAVKDGSKTITPTRFLASSKNESKIATISEKKTLSNAPKGFSIAQSATAEPASDFTGLAPLTRDQLLGSEEASSDEFGSPDHDLFSRVHLRYSGHSKDMQIALGKANEGSR